MLVLVAAGAGTQAFAASSDTYTNTISPAGAPAGANDASSTLTLTNSATSSDLLTAELITLPAGFDVFAGTPTASNGTPWTASVGPNDSGQTTIELSPAFSDTQNGNGSPLAPGDSVSVPLSVSVPCAPSGSTDWTTEAAYTSPIRIEAVNVAAAANTVNGANIAYPVTGACGFRFSTISSPQTVGQPIEFTVSEVDGAGNPASFYTFNPDAAPSGPVLGGTFSSDGGAPVYSLGPFRTCDCEQGGASATGSATDFTPGSNQTLTVSYGSITGTSNAFEVGGCAPGATTCTNTNVEGNTTLTLTFPSPPAGPTPVTFTPAGTPYTCAGLGTVTPGSSIVGFEPSQSADPTKPYSFANPIVATFRYDKSITHGTGVPHFPFCVGDTLADLSQAADCPKRLTSNAQLPCVSHRDKNGGDLMITLLVVPGDPFAGGP